MLGVPSRQVRGCLPNFQQPGSFVIHPRTFSGFLRITSAKMSSKSFIGAGGVALNDNRELLVVREKYGFGGRPATLKLPGGALHSGEHLAEAVVREVLEETGVETRFESVVCFRHWHGYRYGKSDIYFVCRLSPLNTAINMQTEEIQECLWMPVEDFLGSDAVADFNKWIVRAGCGHRRRWLGHGRVRGGLAGTCCG